MTMDSTETKASHEFETLEYEGRQAGATPNDDVTLELASRKDIEGRTCHG